MSIRVECYAGYRGEQEPLAFWLGHFQAGELYLALALLIVLKHAPNIRRLLAGTELKVGVKPSGSAE